MLSFLTSDTMRRIIAALVGLALPVLNQKLGLNIPTEQVIAGLVFVLGYIAQSVANSMHARAIAAGVAASGSVVTPADAAAVINK